MAEHHRNLITLVCFLTLLLSPVAVLAARDLDHVPAPLAGRQQQGGGGGPYYYGYGGGGIPGFPPGGFFGGGIVPGSGTGGGGWGAGYGGPGGGAGYAHGGVDVPTVVCGDKESACYGKKVTCPKKCFWSYSRAGNGYGAGGGGGSCTVDCKYKCTASC